MRRLAASLLVVSLGLTPALSASASALPALRALSSLPAQSAAELTSRLRRAHERTDDALKIRRERFDAWQAANLRRDEAAARVERRKLAGERGPALEDALRSALVLDERANLARSQLMAAEAEVARNGAELLRVYDAVLTLKRREADGLPPRDARRERALSTWQALAEQRDKVRRSLGPVLRESGSLDVGTEANVAARPDDDVETLLEKADLARDLEERFLRRAAAVERRIAELMEERAVARDVAGLVQSQSLFDEDDMRLRVVSQSVRGDPSLPSALPGAGGARDEVQTSRGGGLIESGGAELAGRESSGGNAPPAEPSVGSPAPPPGTDTSPQAGFDAEGVEADDASGVADPGLSALPPDVSGTPIPRAAERAFSPRTADVDVAALLSSGELSLPELRALQKKLRQRAAEMRAQSKELKDTVKERGGR